MNNYIKEIKALAIFLLIGFTFFGFVFLLVYFDIEMFFYYTLLVYMSICAFLVILDLTVKIKFVHQMTRVILIPTGFLYVILTLIMPFITVLVHVLIYLAIAILIPNYIFSLMDYFNLEIATQIPTIIYLKFTASVFIAVLFNYQLRKFIYIISPARIWKTEKLKSYQLDKPTDYILSENNVRFLIYSSYVILLLVLNFKNFEGHNFINDKAILQSFVSFIAFDRSLTLLKQLEFKPSDFLNKILKSILNSWQDFEKKTK